MYHPSMILGVQKALGWHRSNAMPTNPWCIEHPAHHMWCIQHLHIFTPPFELRCPKPHKRRPGPSCFQNSSAAWLIANSKSIWMPFRTLGILELPRNRCPWEHRQLRATMLLVIRSQVGCKVQCCSFASSRLDVGPHPLLVIPETASACNLIVGVLSFVLAKGHKGLPPLR